MGASCSRREHAGLPLIKNGPEDPELVRSCTRARKGEDLTRSGHSPVRFPPTPSVGQGRVSNPPSCGRYPPVARSRSSNVRVKVAGATWMASESLPLCREGAVAPTS
eukprot:scaffold412_cov311-Pavlova_lutheri.AAC.31